MKTTRSAIAKSTLLVSFLMLAACAGESMPIALEPVTPDPESPIAGIQSNGITLFQAVIAQGVPAKVAKKSFEKYEEFKSQVRRTDYIAMVDFTQHSGNKRFYFVNRKSGAVEQWSVAHGAGSDPDNDGIAQYFSNIPDSHMSSLGSYLIQEKYVSSKFGDSMRLDGLEDTNNLARDRAVVLHPSTYVKDGNSKQGRSWGCPAVPYSKIQSLIARSKDGTFMYAYGINKRATVSDWDIIRQWRMIPKALWTNESEDAPIFGE